MEFILVITAVIYFMLGVLITFGMSIDTDHILPKTVGELIIMIIFFPFTILFYSIVGMVYVLDRIFTPIVSSKLWNKKLKEDK